MIITGYIELDTRGNTDILDITSECQKLVKDTGLSEGVVTVFNPGSTGAITTIEYEPNLVKDFRDALETIAPRDKVYEHSKTWHDDNGSSHVKASLMGPSMAVPFIDGSLALGTWQQIVFCDFDTRPRKRRLVVQVSGE